MRPHNAESICQLPSLAVAEESCGLGNIPIPQALLEPVEICSTSHATTSTSASTSTPSSSTSTTSTVACEPLALKDSPATYTNTTDLVVLLSLNAPAEACQSIYAQAEVCRRDQYDRPVLGAVNLCPDVMSAADADLVPLIMHEMIHVLGFATNMMPFFYSCSFNGNNQPFNCTPREPRFVDGTPINYPFISSEIVVRINEELPALVTPAALRAAQQYFGCNAGARAFGARLEDDDNGNYAHWETALFPDELMAPTWEPQRGRYRQLSTLTLSLLKDSGWYAVDVTSAEAGQLPPATPTGATAAAACAAGAGTTCNPAIVPGQCSDVGASRCHPLHYEKASCLASSNLADGCLQWRPLPAAAMGACELPASAAADERLSAEYFGVAGRCLEGPSAPVCLQHRCMAGRLQVRAQGQWQWAACAGSPSQASPASLSFSIACPVYLTAACGRDAPAAATGWQSARLMLPAWQVVVRKSDGAGAVDTSDLELALVAYLSRRLGLCAHQIVAQGMEEVTAGSVWRHEFAVLYPPSTDPSYWQCPIIRRLVEQRLVSLGDTLAFTANGSVFLLDLGTGSEDDKAARQLALILGLVLGILLLLAGVVVVVLVIRIRRLKRGKEPGASSRPSLNHGRVAPSNDTFSPESKVFAAFPLESVSTTVAALDWPAGDLGLAPVEAAWEEEQDCAAEGIMAEQQHLKSVSLSSCDV